MEFPEFHLNEPYVLSPYKICVAAYIVGYLEEYYIEFEAQNGPSKMLNGQMVFQLINSMDLPFKDLRTLLLPKRMKAANASVVAQQGKLSFAGLIKARFDKMIKDFQSPDMGFVRLHDCMNAVSVATTPIEFRKESINAKHQFSTKVRLDRNSLMGFFLRKLRVHFERLAYSEVMALYNQLLEYLAPDKAGNVKHRTNSKPHANITPSEKHPQESKRNYNDGQKSRHNSSPSKPTKKKKKSMLEKSAEDVSMDLTCNTSADMSVDMDIDMDISTNSATKSLASTSAMSTALNATVDTLEQSTQSSMLTTRVHEDVGSSSRVHSQYASEHFIVSQLQKIITNEVEALPPGELFRVLALHFEQFTPYQYHRFIKLNYFANLSMLREFTASNLNQLTERPGRGHNLGNIDGMFHGPGGIVGGPAVATVGGIPTRAVGPGDLSGGVFGLSAASHAGVLRKRDPLVKKAKDLFQAINFNSDIQYLKFVNSLRLMDYTTAKEYFYAYFDLKKYQRPPRMGWNQTLQLLSAMRASGNPPNLQTLVNGQPNQYQYMSQMMAAGSNFSWAALNLAIMHAHFGHYRLAYEALADCITMARERHEDRCLQFAMLWMLIILQQFDQSGLPLNGGTGEGRRTSSFEAGIVGRFHGPHHDLHLTENLTGLIAISKTPVPHIAGLAYLQLEKLCCLRPIHLSAEDMFCDAMGWSGIKMDTPRRVPLSSKPTIFAAQARMDDLMAKSMMMKAAILNAYGASHEAAFLSQALLRLDLSTNIAGENILLVDESHAIAVRNLAHYWWFVRGQSSVAIDLLTRFKRHYRSYNTSLRVIIERALSDVRFDQALAAGDWARVTKEINLVRIFDRNQALFMQAQLKRRQGEHMAALELLEAIFTSSGTSAADVKPATTAVGAGGGGTKKTSTKGNNNNNNFVRLATDQLGQKRNLFSPSGLLISRKMSTDTETSVVIESSSKNNIRGSPFSPADDVYHRQDASQSSHSSMAQLPPSLAQPQERPLSTELDPYLAVSVSLLKATLLANLGHLSEVLVAAKSHGFRQLEARTLLEIARVQHTQFGHFAESQRTINICWIRLAAGGALRDLCTAYYLTAANHFRMSRDAPVVMPITVMLSHNHHRKIPLEVAHWTNQRAYALALAINDKFEMLEILNLGALIEHCRGNFAQRNLLARKYKDLRKSLLKC